MRHQPFTLECPVSLITSTNRCSPRSNRHLKPPRMPTFASVDRHILRNHIFLYAIENNEPFPIGGLDASMLDSRFSDEDPDDVILIFGISDDEDDMSIDITEAQTTS